jgi:ATP-binding cassette subfamily B (MDR/TAP) protein 1
MGILQEAITSKAAIMLSAIATFCVASIIAFIVYWKTALILTPFFVTILLVFSISGKLMVKHQKASREMYGHAASIPEEAFNAIKQIAAYGMEEFVRERYSQSLRKAEEEEKKAQITMAGLVASMNAIPCLIYALSFWTGSIFLVEDEMSSADITMITLAVTIGVFAIIRIAPSTQALTSGIAITGSLLETIARKSPQDPLGEDGNTFNNVTGDITLSHVDLIYPSRDHIKVLDDINLRFLPNKKTAIVGPSGGGKSSIFGLLERFYEPTHGVISKRPEI